MNNTTIYFIKLLKEFIHTSVKTKPGTFVPGFFFCRGGRIAHGLIGPFLKILKNRSTTAVTYDKLALSDIG
jgi:hypothetical protein